MILEEWLGYSKKRLDKSGKARYTACYMDAQGRERSAGTFPSRKLADHAWRKAESGRLGVGAADPQRGRQRFEVYVEREWLPNHVMELSTRQSYTYTLYRHVMPYFAQMKMWEILPTDVREFVTHLIASGVNPPTIEACKVVLDAIFTTAFDDGVTILHAGHGVKIPTVAKRKPKIVTVEQFDAIYGALDAEVWRLLVETAIETGLRWGELTELRPKDIDFSTGTLTVSRAVVSLVPKFHPEGKRFLVKDYPKDGEIRSFRIADHLLDKLKSWIATMGIAPDELIFQQPEAAPTLRDMTAELPDPTTLGRTEPNAQGRTYPHGTPTAYGRGKCRCQHCRNAVAAYRARRRAEGKDRPRVVRVVDTDRHISSRWFSTNVWNPVLEQSGLSFRITPHGLRAAHASWLLAGGADVHVVKDRLGHGSLSTTEKYIGTLPGREDVALDAMATIRGDRSPHLGLPAANGVDLDGLREEIRQEFMAKLARTLV